MVTRTKSTVWPSLVLLALMATMARADVERPGTVIPPLPRKKKIPFVKPKPEIPPPPERPNLPRLPVPRRLRPAPPGPLPLPKAPETPTELQRVRSALSSYLTEIDARRRVQAGHMDPAWVDLAQRTEHYFQPDFDMVREERITEISGAWALDGAFKTLQGWYLPYLRDQGDPFLRPTREAGDATRWGFGGLLDLNRRLLHDPNFGDAVTTLVEVRFGPSGEIQTHMAASSGHPRHDSAALASIRRALQNDWGDQPPPDNSRALYAIQSRYHIMPPLPIVGFSFDAWFFDWVPFYPLKKSVSDTVVVVAVYREKPRK